MKNYLFLILITFSIYSKAQDCSVAYQYVLGGRFFIKIPDCLEYQDRIMKKNVDHIHQQMGINYDDKVVFQRKGMNDAYLTVRQPSYEKVFYEMHLTEAETFKKLGSAFTPSEITAYSNDILATMKSSNSILLLNWDKPYNVKIGNLSVLKISYVRQFTGNEAVKNTSYYIQDNDRLHIISLSYRVSQAEIWQSVMSKIILSLTTNQ